MKSAKEKLPEIDLKELERERQANARQRMEFIDYYVDWIKKTPDETVSNAYKKFINSLYPRAKKH